MIHLDKYFICSWEECTFYWYCWERSIYVIFVKLFVGIAQVLYFLTDFLSTCSIDFWDRSIKISDYIFSVFLLKFSHSFIIWSSVIRCINVYISYVHLKNESCCHQEIFTLFLGIFFLKPILSNINSHSTFLLISANILHLSLSFIF